MAIDYLTGNEDYIGVIADPVSDATAMTFQQNADSSSADVDAINSFFLPNPPPTPEEDLLAAPARTNDPVYEPPIKHLNARSITLDPSWAPVQILPQEPHRKSILLTNFSPGGVGRLYVSAEPTFLTGTNIAAGFGIFQMVSGEAISLEDYNGPLWAWADTAGIIINAVAVLDNKY